MGTFKAGKDSTGKDRVIDIFKFHEKVSPTMNERSVSIMDKTSAATDATTIMDVSAFQEAVQRGDYEVVMAFLDFPGVFDCKYEEKTRIQGVLKWIRGDKSDDSPILCSDKDENVKITKYWVKDRTREMEAYFKKEYVKMIKSITQREAQSFFTSILRKVKPIKSNHKLTDRFGDINYEKYFKPESNQSPKSEPKNIFKGKWVMLNDEYITVGSYEKNPQHFWARRSEHGWIGYFNENIKGANRAVEVNCESYSICIPFTSHRAFLKLFLQIDDEANTEVRTKSGRKVIKNVFDEEFVRVSLIYL